MVNGPYRDDDVSDDRRFRPPKALRKMRKQFTYERQLQKFREVFSRDPHGEAELEMFVESYLLELYNSGKDVPN